MRPPRVRAESERKRPFASLVLATRAMPRASSALTRIVADAQQAGQQCLRRPAEVFSGSSTATGVASVASDDGNNVPSKNVPPFGGVFLRGVSPFDPFSHAKVVKRCLDEILTKPQIECKTARVRVVKYCPLNPFPQRSNFSRLAAAAASLRRCWSIEPWRLAPAPQCSAQLCLWQQS